MQVATLCVLTRTVANTVSRCIAAPLAKALLLSAGSAIYLFHELTLALQDHGRTEDHRPAKYKFHVSLTFSLLLSHPESNLV